MSNLKTSEQRKTRVRQAIKYWTKKRMAQAKPIALKVAPTEFLEQGLADIGDSRIVQPVLPGGKSKMLAETSEVTDIAQFPFSFVGKLFMREGDNDYVGSAWVIGDQAIFTAAHCLFDDNGTFFDDVVFVPQFLNGQNSAGRFGVVQMSVDGRYASSGGEDLEFDMGIATLDRSIGNLTGIAGYAINPISQIAPGEFVTGAGYPAGPPFDGSKMFKSKGRVRRDEQPGTTAERYFGAENDMTGGCSGGPWFDSSSIVVGLNSFVFVNEDPPTMYSPYFGQGFVDLLDWAKDNGGMPENSTPDDNDSGEDSSGNDDLKKTLQFIVDKLTEVIDEID